MDPALSEFLDPQTTQTVLLLGVIAVALLCGTHVISSLVRNLTHLHDTHVRVRELHNKYHADLLRLKGYDIPGEELGGVEIIDDGEPPAAEPDAPAANEPDAEPTPIPTPIPAPEAAEAVAADPTSDARAAA